MVLDGLSQVPLRFIRVAEVPVRLALPRPVAHLFCNRQVLPVVLDGLAEVPLRLIRDAKYAVDKALLGIEVRTAAATALAARSCAATPRQSASPASCSSIFNTGIWSAVGFAAVWVSARAAATHSPLCPAFHALVWQQKRDRVRVGEAERR